MPRISFTPLKLKNLAPPPRAEDGKIVQVDYWDESTPGFGLRVSSSGARTWVVLTRTLRRGERRLARFVLGRYTAQDGDPSGLTLAAARAQAQQTLKLAKTDEDPKLLKQRARQQKVQESRNTFGAIADLFLKPDATERERRPATLEQYRRVLKGITCSEWQDRPLASITQQDIAALVRDIKARGTPIAANRALSAVRAMLNWAAANAYIPASPARQMRAPSEEKPRERHLFGDTERSVPSEIGLAWEAFGRTGWSAPFLRMLVLTGQRRSEVAGMRWDELIDLEGKAPRWALPGSRTKNKRDHMVPLGPEAVAILKGVARVKDCSFVFSTNGRSPISGFGKIKARADTEIAALIAENPSRYKGQFVASWTPHDLRRTFETGLRELGVSGEVMDALTNHVSGEARRGARKHYNHARHELAKREAIERWERHVLGTGRTADVVRLPLTR